MQLYLENLEDLLNPRGGEALLAERLSGDGCHVVPVLRSASIVQGRCSAQRRVHARRRRPTATAATAAALKYK